MWNAQKVTSKEKIVIRNKQKVTSNQQKVTNDERKVTSNEKQAKIFTTENLS